MTRIFLTTLTVVALVASGCNKKKDDPAPPTGGGGGGGGGGNSALTASTPCSAQMTVNGSAVTYTADGWNWLCGTGSSGGGLNPGEMSYRTFDGFISDDTGYNAVGVELGRFGYMHGGPMPDSTFFSFFQTGTLQFGDPDAEQNKVAVYIWQDGELYSTKCGSGTPSGSAFQITQVAQFPNSITHSSVKFRVTFNGTLYPCSGVGEPKTITNGTAVLAIENI